MARAFVAVYPTPAAHAALAGAVARLRAAPEAGAVRWVRPEQWHVTLLFLGEVADLAPVAAALDPLGALGPVRARLGPSSGWLPGGRVLQVPVAGLDDLAVSVRRALHGIVGPQGPLAGGSQGGEPLGFLGHLTLGRARRPGKVPGGTSGLPVAHGPTPWWWASLDLVFEARELALVVSVLGQGPPLHQVVHRVALAGSGGTLARTDVRF
jgi:2'-5' RNA ligase